jgi:hypothetical protein
MQGNTDLKLLSAASLESIKKYSSSLCDEISVMQDHFIKNENALNDAVLVQIKKLLQLIHMVVG